MKKLLRQATAMIAIIALAVTLISPSALAEAKTSFARSQIDFRSAKLYSEAELGIEEDSRGIEIVPHKTENPKRSEVWDGSIAASFAGGSGTEADPYLISNGSELAYLAQEVNDNDNSYSGVYFKLTNDIYLNDTSDWENWGDGETPQNEWTAIGGYRNDEDEVFDFRFNGCFDGDGYAVRGIYIQITDFLDSYQGLFGYIGVGSVIANLGVAESYICGYSLAGGVVGINGGGTVTNCYNTGRISGEEKIGGVVGMNYDGDVTDCHNTGFISGNNTGIGGVVGMNEYGNVANCYNTGNVNGNVEVGGIVGTNYSYYKDKPYVHYTAAVVNCYNVGNVSGSSWVGGLVGSNSGGIIFECNNSGIISGERFYVGGVIGWNCGGVTDCYNNGSVSGCYDDDGETNPNYVGGVVGTNLSWYDGFYEIFYTSTITNCYNMGSISGGEDVGGVSGGNEYSTVTNCYNMGSISGEKRIGGVVGDNSYGTVNDCYNAGSVIGKDVLGGIVGADFSFYDEEIDVYYEGIVTDCYNIGNVIGETDVGGAVGAMFGPYDDDNVTNCYYLNTCCANGNEYGTALTDQQMQASDSFIGFDFVEVWTMDGNPEYPYPELASNIHGGMPVVTTEPGDANGDGKITIADATLISRMALNLTESVPAADFNGDGSINIADATLTARKALNLI